MGVPPPLGWRSIEFSVSPNIYLLRTAIIEIITDGTMTVPLNQHIRWSAFLKYYVF